MELCRRKKQRVVGSNKAILPHTFCVLKFLTLSNNNWTASSVLNKFISGDSRNSRTDMFYKKGVLENFTKFTRKFLCQSLFFLKKGSGTGVFL